MANELTLQISGWGLMLGSVRSARLPCEAQVRYGIFAAQLHRAIRNLTGFSPVGRSAQGGLRIRVQQQPMKLLEILLEHPEELVTREELRSRVWPSESFGDFDQALNIAIRKLGMPWRTRLRIRERRCRGG